MPSIRQRSEFDKYREDVLDYLEYLGYFEIIAPYHPDDVAYSLLGVMQILYRNNWSPRMTALINYGLTWNKIKNGINIDKIRVN